MVGLSIVLEMTNTNNNTLSDGCLISPKVVNKANVMINTPTTNNLHPCHQDSGFLKHCCLCRRKLLPAKDIYMYKGDRAFCSVECRSKQMIMDDEESLRSEYCSLMDVKKKKKSDSSGPHRRRVTVEIRETKETVSFTEAEKTHRKTDNCGLFYP